MNKFKKIFICFLFFCFLFILFKYNYILNKSVIEAVNLWLTKVFPSLFIMMILNDLIINLNVLEYLNKLINPLFNKIFKTNGDSSCVFLLAIFSGTPSSAFIIKEMLNNKKISINDANKLISFTFFFNPLFLYNILSLIFNKYITIKIILIHYLTNIIIGLIVSNNSIDNEIIITKEKIKKESVLIILPKAIKKSLDNLLMILGTIVFYMIITNLVINITTLPNIIEVIFKGLLEVTQSLNGLITLNTTSIIKEIIAISIISFGGISIHTQVLSIINDTEVKYKYFLKGRVLHALLSTGTYFLFF